MHSGVVVITTAQLHSTKPELRFSNPVRGGLEIRDGEDLWQWSRLEIRLNAFRQSTIPEKQFIIINIIIISFSYGAVSNFLRGTVLYPPPMDACPIIKFFLFHPLFMKITEVCDWLYPRHFINESRDRHCSSNHSNIFNVHLQRANNPSQICVRINWCSVIWWSCSCYSIEGENL